MSGQVAELQQGLSELRERLKGFQPTPETEMAALEADGYVVSVIPEDKIAYINLNKKDHIYRGMTFTVYDSYESIPKSGKGKGSLEVVEIMDSISTTNPCSADRGSRTRSEAASPPDRG